MFYYIFNFIQFAVYWLKGFDDKKTLFPTIPTLKFPAYYRDTATTIKLFPNISQIACNYIRRPSIAKWGYVVVNEKALYNAGTSINFELHKSDESELVYKILSLAGITIHKPGLGTYGDQQITNQTTQEKQ